MAGSRNEEKIYEIVKSIIEFIKSSSTDRNMRKKQMLFFEACKLALTDTVNLLLENGVDVRATDFELQTALHYVFQYNHYYLEHCSCEPNRIAIAKSLLEKGALVNGKTIEQKTPLHYLCERCEDVNLLQMLLDNNADFKAVDNAKNTVLHSACTKDYISAEVVSFILKQGVSVNSQNQNNETPLHFAASHCYETTAICILLGNGANVNSRNSKKQTPLHCAYQRLVLKDDIIKMLLEYEADINAVDVDNRTVLFYACERTRTTESNIKFILENNVSVNCQDNDGNTPLHLAALKGNEDISRFLIQNGANINIGNNRNVTPLHNAYIRQDYDNTAIVELLLDNNADVHSVDTDNRSILHYACQNVRTTLPMIAQILKRNVSVDIADINNDTPLHFAAFHCNDEIVDYLVKSGACVNSTNNKKVTVLHKAVSSSNYFNFSKVNLLLKNNASIDAIDSNEQTVLHYACQSDYVDKMSLELILNRGISVNCKDLFQNTPLHFAALNGVLLPFKFLVERGADVDSINNDGLTPLHNVCKSKKRPIREKLNYLLQKGAKVNIVDGKKRTILHHASENLEVEPNTIDIILKSGVSINCQDIDGNTPLHLAASNGNKKLYNHLLDKGANDSIVNNNQKKPLENWLQIRKQ